MKNPHLFLIFTPIDKQKYKDADTHYSPSLSLIALKNFIEQHNPNVKITLLDGSVTHSQGEILNLIQQVKPTHIGQSIQLISYPNSLEIAKAGKNVGAINILGGHHATQMFREIIKNRSGLVDYVVIGDGEIALSAILAGKDIRTIPNIAYSTNGNLSENSQISPHLDTYPVTNYSGIDFTPYRNLLSTSLFNIAGNDTYLRMYSHKGCGNRGGSHACIFCGRADRNVRFKTPDRYWEDVTTLVEENGADYIFDVGDDFLASEDWLRRVLETKPHFSKHYQLGVFGRANRITQEKANILKSLNVSDVVIGFETGAPEVMSKIGKRNTSVDTSIQAATHLFTQDIDVCASFVFGLPGETEKSIASTISVAHKIFDLSKKIRGVEPREIVGNLLEPSPGSPAFKKIREQYPEKYNGKDILSLEELQYDYFRIFMDISTIKQYEFLREKLRDAAQEIHSLVKFSDSQGWLNSELSQQYKN